MFWRSQQPDEYTDEESYLKSRAPLRKLGEAYREVKDKIKVVAADITLAIGRRYAVLLGVDPNDKDFQPKFRILKVDRLKSHSSKYSLNIPSDRVSPPDLVRFVTRYLSDELQPYKISESDPKHILNSNNVIPLNRIRFLEWIQKVKSSKTDVLVVFYANEGCSLCEGLWGILDQVAQK